MAEKNKDQTFSKTQPVKDVAEGKVLTQDEYRLAQLGYKQEFFRHLGLFESWAATFASMNFVSGIFVLFGWIMYSGGIPKSAFANWTMVSGLSSIVLLVMAEIAAALPTAGGIYFWSYRSGGPKWGPFLSWMTAWWNWAGWICIVPGVQQGSTNFLLSALEIKYPNAEILEKGWVFYGYDISAHLAEETNDASIVVARGMWMSTFSAWIGSVPTLILILFCMQDFDKIISAKYSNNWAEYLVQLIGPNGAVAILSLLWVDSTCATASCFYQLSESPSPISRDGVLPFSKYFRRLNGRKISVNSAFLVYVLSIAITCARHRFRSSVLRYHCDVSSYTP
ncbi:hypothetical protein VTN00DRAFT_5635 [Thermoascus crustaceus]|uniref:uncharacterized protein n=1 Tax=Thermoascus crustaceus TaxID=5088 RepID=UPI0037438E21